MAWATHDRVAIPDGGEVICWDLDSTLRSTMSRRHMVPEIRVGRSTWDDYSLACADDEPIEGAVVLLRLLENQAWNIAVSGCADSALGLTRAWARKHDVPLDDYLLRPAGDRTPNGEWKVAAVRRLQEAGLEVRLFIEDWGPAAKHIREQTGVPVLGVNPFDEDTALVTREQLAAELEAVLEVRYGRGHDHETGTCHVSGRELASQVFDRLGGAL